MSIELHRDSGVFLVSLLYRIKLVFRVVKNERDRRQRRTWIKRCFQFMLARPDTIRMWTRTHWSGDFQMHFPSPIVTLLAALYRCVAYTQYLLSLFHFLPFSLSVSPSPFPLFICATSHGSIIHCVCNFRLSEFFARVPRRPSNTA